MMTKLNCLFQTLFQGLSSNTYSRNDIKIIPSTVCANSKKTKKKSNIAYKFVYLGLLLLPQKLNEQEPHFAL